MGMRALVVFLCLAATPVFAQPPRVFPPGTLPADQRLEELQNLNGYFPFKQVDNADQWRDRQKEIRRRILISQGLWPTPTKAPLNAVIHGRVERDDYVVDRVYFESIPGHYVTGSLYRPKGKPGPFPAILSPHGHWSQGRFYDAGETQVENDIKIGAEQFSIGGRYPIQARAVGLARMGCIVFVYDMTGNADSVQIKHRPDKWSHLDGKEDWGFMSVQAELRLQNMMGLQTWNSIRAIDFLQQLEDVDSARIGVTGASGGGTQSMIIGAIDERIAAAMPCVMVSTAMQGGCTCENAPLMRIDQGNIDIAAAVAPRPLGLTAADDWTVQLETKGFPDLANLYQLLGHRDRLTAVFHTQFKHNYNQVNRLAMYQFFNRHFDLGITQPIGERDFQPLTKAEATVWNDDHPAPSGNRVGDRHEVRILRMAARDSAQAIDRLVPQSSDDLTPFRQIVGGAWETILGRRFDQVGEVTFTETARRVDSGITAVSGHVDHAEAGEQFPAFRLSPDGANRGTVIWISDSGKAGLFEAGRWIDPVKQLLDAGYSVLAADLFGQGEFLKDGKPIESQRMWHQRGGQVGWNRFAGYTYGYNHPLFVRRVHDILSLTKLAKQKSQTVHLAGLDSAAGPLVLAARSQMGGAVDQTFVDLNGFRFGVLTRHDHPMFVPGAVKYLDVNGIIAVSAPAKLSITGASPTIEVTQVLKAANVQGSVAYHPTQAKLLESMARRLGGE